MTTDVFSDSTTLIYPLDRTDPAKKARCVAWLRILRKNNCLALSPQVLNESYWVVSRKPAFIWARPHVRTYLMTYAPWATAPLNAQTLADAFQIEDRYGLRFWDAMIIASANAAGCDYLLSEDLNDGQVYGSVRVINPFRHAPVDVLGPALQP
jgi:predicted nucleic acid-binding protein